MRTKFYILPMLLLLLTTLVSPVPVQARPGLAAGVGPAFNLVGQMGGVTNVVALSGGQLYTNVGPRIARMAVANPGAPSLPATYGAVLPGIPADIQVANGYLYVALGADGVAVVDANTLNLLSVQPLPVAGFASEVAVGSQRLYAAAGNLGVVAYNLGADMKTLAWSETVPVGASRNAVDVVTHAYAGAESLYVAVNDFDPVTPAGAVYKYDITTSPALGTPSASAEMAANALEVTDAFVYVAEESNEMVLLDAATLGDPGGTPSSVELSGPVLDLALASANETEIYALELGGIEAIDISDPTAPLVQSAAPFLSAGAGQDFEVAQFPGDANNYLYVADGDMGFSILTAPKADPANLTLASPSYIKPRPADTSQAIEGTGQAYAFANATDLWTINNTNPAALSVVGGGLTPTLWPHDMTSYANILLIAGGSDGLLRMEAAQGSEPTNMVGFSAGIDVNDYAYEAVMSYPNVYVADGANGLAVVDPSTMDVLIREKTGDPASDFQMIDVAGSYAYVVDAMDMVSPTLPAVFRIYDVSTPASPVAKGAWSLESFCGTGGLVLDLKVYDHFALLACGDAGVKVVDVTDPANALLLGAAGYDSPGHAQDLSVFDNNLYVADGNAGLEWLTIDPSGTLALQAAIHVAGGAMQVTGAADGYAYVSSGQGGMQVFQQAIYTWQCFMPLVTR